MSKSVFHLICIMVFAVIILSSCKTNNSNQTLITNLSKQYAEQMANGNFDNVVNIFDSKMKAVLTKDKLIQIWADTVKNIGKYDNIRNTDYTINDKGYQVTVVLDYEQRGLKVLFSFDNTNKINGLWINYLSTSMTSIDSAAQTNIKIGKEPYLLDGILCLPENIINPPVVILVQGSGQSDYDHTIGANKPFKDIANGLVDKGIATIRYNKRYYQYPETAPKNITIQDEVSNDVGYAIQFIKQNDKLQSSKIYILGHSLGGMLAPYIASINTDVSGIISLAGTPRKLEDVILDQNIAAIKALTDKTDDEKNQLIDFINVEVDKVKALKDNDTETTLFNVNSSYWLSMNKIDTVTISKDLIIPILIMQGNADFQVLVEVDYKAWQDILSFKDNVTFKLYDNLNHLFMLTNGKKDLSEYNIKGSVDGKVIGDIADWIKSNTVSK